MTRLDATTGYARVREGLGRERHTGIRRKKEKPVVTRRANALELRPNCAGLPADAGGLFPTVLARRVWLRNVYVATPPPDPRPHFPIGDVSDVDKVFQKDSSQSPGALFAFQSDGHRRPLCRPRQCGRRRRQTQADVRDTPTGPGMCVKATRVRGKMFGRYPSSIAVLGYLRPQRILA